MIKKTLYVCFDHSDIIYAQEKLGLHDKILILRDMVQLCDINNPLIAEDYDDNFRIEHFPNELDFLKNIFKHNINMVYIFGFYHANILINAINKNISNFDKIWLDDSISEFTGPVYFKSSFEGGDYGRSSIKKYVLPILRNTYKENIKFREMIIRLKTDRLKLIKFFILKLMYLFLLSFRSYFLKDNTKLLKSKLNIGLYRSNSQLSIFNLMNKDEYNLIKIPVIKEIFKKSSLNNSVRLRISDLFFGLIEWIRSYRKYPKQNESFDIPNIYKQIYYETYLASLENFVLEKWVNRLMIIAKKNKISKVANLEFRSPQASVFFNCAKQHNIYVEQFLAMDIFDMKLDLPHRKYGDILVTPSNYYLDKFIKVGEKNIITHEVFTQQTIQNLKKPLPVKKYKKIYLVLRVDATENKIALVKKIFKLCQEKNIELKVRPHPRGLPSQLSFLNKDNTSLCYKNWNELIIDEDEIVITFYSAALFEILSNNHDFLLVNEGRVSFAGLDLSKRLVDSVERINELT